MSGPVDFAIGIAIVLAVFAAFFVGLRPRIWWETPGTKNDVFLAWCAMAVSVSLIVLVLS